MVTNNCLVFRATNESEIRFYELLRNNALISVKDICRKVPRKMAYKYMKDLLEMQERLGSQIIEKKAGICSRTSMPIVVLERKMEVELEELPNSTLVFFSKKFILQTSYQNH